MTKEDSKTQKVKLPTYKDLKKYAGTFKNIEAPGMPLTFSYRGNWEGPIEQYSLMDGFDYKLPEEVIDHINGANNWKSCTYKKQKWITTEGKETTAMPLNVSNPSITMPTIQKSVGETKNRFMFLRKS